MIGKIARMMAGRSAARRLGYGAGSGALVGLVAPFAIRTLVSLVGKAGRKATDARRRPVEPEFGQPVSRQGIGPDNS
ncbi:MAG TPA: hypothetical protein VF628_12205 [Allosphingosinicella sp.]